MTLARIHRDLATNSLNISGAELECYFEFYNRQYPGNGHHRYCNATWDGLSCWPTTAAGRISTIPCFAELNGVLYDTTHNVTRICHENGVWANKSNYDLCNALLPEEEIIEVLWVVKEAATIYYVGYGVSLVALIFALWIFLYFKDLRCLRNTIHTNLMVTYLLIDLTWTITATLQSSSSSTTNKAACILVIFLTYLMGTNFFWMFVEGLYLYILVVKTFSVELVKFHIYAIIGWGFPAIVVVIWAVIKFYYTSTGDPDLGHMICLWQTRDYYDYIFICPVMLVLVINIFFLAEIMWVLITKLRAAQTVESKQYRKAAKALLVLIPLLGVTYIVVLVTPSHSIARVVFTYLQATLLSTQGLTVAVLYCFLNGEVRNSLRHHLERWKTQRTLDSNAHTIASRNSQQGETTRLYSVRKPRGSCASFTTTTSYVNNYCTRCSVTKGQILGNHNLNSVQDDMV